MVIEKMTKNILMKFAPGDQKVFTLPNFEKAQSAAVQAYKAKNFTETYGWKFSARIGDPMEGTLQRSVTITRIS
jgi:hypothetical protein